MKFRVDTCVCDSCIKDEKDEIVLIVNSRANALTICEILNLDENHENGMLAPIGWESQKFIQVRKETAEKILQEILLMVSCWDGRNVHINHDELVELGKKYDVDMRVVEE